MDLSGIKSHDLIEDGFTLLENLDHRGARGAEEKTGDGVGMLIQKPHDFFTSEVDGLGAFDEYAVGQMFLPRADAPQAAVRERIATIVREEGFEIIAWREVPTDNSDLGKTALETEPDVCQLFVKPRQSLAPEKMDVRLYILRRVIEQRVAHSDLAQKEQFYVCSLDRRKIVYKGLLTNSQLRLYYPGLSDERMTSSIVFVHSRFSTNTLGAWPLAHPYRTIIHNGEINTLRGNINWMKAREADLASDRFGEEIEKITPITSEDQSDTAVLDNVLELLIESGRSLPHALRMLVPEAWNKDQHMSDERRAWYNYHSTIVEPWDGPALVAATDGYRVGAILDRNGLRPCRYYITRDNRLIMASEAGVLDTPPDQVVEKGRLQPGQMFYVDPDEGRVIPDEEIFDRLTHENYGKWVAENEVHLDEVVSSTDGEMPPLPDGDLAAFQRAFGYSLEHIERLVKPIAEEGKDPIGAMGNDTPMAVLSNQNKTLFTYFKQLFAQVSNPPIDYIREDLVTSLESHVGFQRNLLDETPEHARQLFLESPILTEDQQRALRKLDHNGIRSHTIDITYPRGESLREAVEEIRREAVRAIDEGYEILILSDRKIGPDRVAIPSLLATGGVHHHLVREGLRTHVGLVLDSGQPCAVHHFCTLIGYGADAVTPYLAYESIRQLIAHGVIDRSNREALGLYRHGVEDGIRKVMSKMGISTLESYKGAQIFEAVGLKSDFVEEYFAGTVARTEGVGVEEIEDDLLERHDRAFRSHVKGNLELETGGELYWRRDGEFHQWNPFTIGSLQKATQLNDSEIYEQFAHQINKQDQQLQTFRGLLDFDTDGVQSIPVDDVEPAEEIFKRFFTSSMSFGSLSKEAHETLAVAMNRLGGYASTGSGGEEVERFNTDRECANKQVASGRFGVTSYYLAHADHLEIKMAQGSKPGEGGHLPGGKVNEVIAKVRHTTPGVALISPPPHHDIYSIEDLAQLIHDLKCSNPDADVHVKLVAEAGVGVIAAGVSKARADAVLISGQSGGTGASPKTSIKSAGLPWELGLSEAHQVLLANRLRSRIRVRVDGGLKTGRDVAIAALLGAEEFGFGTAALITCGCIMLRKCSCNTCSVGVATQDPALREKFMGKPEYVENYMRFMAEELRGIMAELGFCSVDEMVGRVDRLKQRSVDHPKARNVDLSALLYRPSSEDQPRKTREQNHHLGEKLDRELIDIAAPALEEQAKVEASLPIVNRNRTVGTMLSARVVKKYGEEGLPEDTITFHFDGSAGQSMGAFLAPGITLDLEGDANDYIGKGLSGGKLIVRTPDNASYRADENIIIGNIALYGATSGEAYFNGMAGERFAVRNSGVMTVVEGVGDHGCEYMTGGVAVILGETGRNFAAGMSGGEAYVLDESGAFEDKVNYDMVHLEEMSEERDRRMVRRLVENHYYYTQSDRAEEVLSHWEDYVGRFYKVMPDAFARVIEERMAEGEDIRVHPPAARVPL
jgi:glutamate synthase (NADPH/NADH) large chain